MRDRVDTTPRFVTILRRSRIDLKSIQKRIRIDLFRSLSAQKMDAVFEEGNGLLAESARQIMRSWDAITNIQSRKTGEISCMSLGNTCEVNRARTQASKQNLLCD